MNAGPSGGRSLLVCVLVVVPLVLVVTAVTTVGRASKDKIQDEATALPGPFWFQNRELFLPLGSTREVV